MGGIGEPGNAETVIQVRGGSLLGRSSRMSRNTSGPLNPTWPRYSVVHIVFRGGQLGDEAPYRSVSRESIGKKHRLTE